MANSVIKTPTAESIEKYMAIYQITSALADGLSRLYQVHCDKETARFRMEESICGINAQIEQAKIAAERDVKLSQEETERFAINCEKDIGKMAQELALYSKDIESRLLLANRMFDYKEKKMIEDNKIISDLVQQANSLVKLLVDDKEYKLLPFIETLHQSIVSLATLIFRSRESVDRESLTVSRKA